MPRMVKNVMVVEDDASVASDVAARLRTAGYVVEVAPTLAIARRRSC
jgi:DNA-binding response OmpR family regulator